MSVIYKTFKTPLFNYVYDRHTNKILRISEEDYNALNSGIAQNSEIFTKYQKRGFLLESQLCKIEHPMCGMLEHIHKNRLEYLILQVTQECNLRCSYCIYSGNYENRTHSNKEMSFDLAKKAIDFYMKNTGELPEVSLGFYGGEPLLKINLIKQCVDYIKSLSKERNVIFNITTNGTLLTLENAKYLYENNFNVVISLDGAKTDHDKNRVFKANGKGSFDTIMNNIGKIKNSIPHFLDNITFNTVLNHNCDYSCVKDYFNTDEIVRDANYIFNMVETETLKNKSNFSDDFIIANSYDYFLLFRSMIGKFDKNRLLKSIARDEVSFIDFYKIMNESAPLNGNAHHNGPCIPGGRRLFVSVTGKFYPCERVPEESVMEIGDIDNGLNEENAKTILNIGLLTRENCEKCWALRLCDQCVSKAVEDGCLSKKFKLNHCGNSKNISLEKLKIICMLKEFGYKFEGNKDEKVDNLSI